MPAKYKEVRSCQCGYETLWTSAWSRHRQCCAVANVRDESNNLVLRIEQLTKELAHTNAQMTTKAAHHTAQLITKDVQLVTQLAIKDEQLAAKDAHHAAEVAAKDAQIAAQEAQLVAKDAQISDLIKCPRTVRTVNKTINNVNIIGHESVDHIPMEEIKRLLSDPATAVPKFIRMKRAVAHNLNVRVPNKKQNIYQVVRQNGDSKEWQQVPKAEALEALYNENAGVLEIEASEEDSKRGDRFIDFHDRVKDSAHGDKKLFNSQLESIHCVVSERAKAS